MTDNSINNWLTLAEWSKRTLRQEFTLQEQATIAKVKSGMDARFKAFMEELNDTSR